MGVPDGSLQDLERQRLELEANILKLQESLYHWRTWEAEYDGLKEEINDLDDGATTNDFLRIGRDFGGSLVSEDEVKVIIGEKQVKRTKQQVVDLISRRIDYVKVNVATMEKKLRTAENQLYALQNTEQLPLEPTADFPMTEIMEELDENGNVISSSTSTPGDQAPELLEILKKAGVKDVPDVLKEEDPEPPTTESKALMNGNKEVWASESKDSKPEKEDETPKAPKSTVEAQKEEPVTNVNESPEDAELRREMLRYSLDEVGAVVAELELDEDASEISVDEEYDYDYDDDDDDEEEDEFGRTRVVLDEEYHQQMRELEKKLNARGMWNVGKDTTALPEDVQKELERPVVASIEKPDGLSDKPAQEKKPKKKVAFAEELDIAPAPKPTAPGKRVLPPKEPEVSTMSDAIIERTQPAEKTPAASSGPKKVSRFKSNRKVPEASATNDATAPVLPTNGFHRPAEPRLSQRKPNAPPPGSLPLFPARPTEPKPFSQPISDIVEKALPPPPQPEGPEGKILADTLVERTVSEGTAAAPEPDELDEQLHRKEIATEFYRMRNRMIQQSGGFVDNEPEVVPVETEEAPNRVSKFKAARMRHP